MRKVSIEVNPLKEVAKKDLTLVGYLTLSSGIGYLLATYVAKDPVLTAVFAPAINYILYRLKKEIDHEGYREALK